MLLFIGSHARFLQLKFCKSIYYVFYCANSFYALNAREQWQNYTKIGIIELDAKKSDIL